jgi:hypothetical protein
LKKQNLILALTFLLSFIYVKTESQEKLIELSGKVSDIANESVKNVFIGIISKHRITQTDTKGMFSMIVERHDTVMFACPGFKKRKLIMPDTLTDSFYYVDVTLVPDTIIIDPVTIFPWKTYSEFKVAFLALKQEQDRDIQNAIKNIALINTFVYLSNKPDPELNFQHVMQQQIDHASHLGMGGASFSLLNPFAWTQFFEALSDGTFKNSKDIPPPPNQ